MSEHFIDNTPTVQACSPWEEILVNGRPSKKLFEKYQNRNDLRISKLEQAVKVLRGMGEFYSKMACFGNPESAKHARLALKQVDEILGGEK